MRSILNHMSTALMAGLLVTATMTGCGSSRGAAEMDSAEADSKSIDGGRPGSIAATASEETGWDSTVDEKEAAEKPFSLTEGLLRGQVAGVQVTGDPLGPLSVRIRGNSSILGSSEPLYVVDGMPVLHLSDGMINPHDIESIEVLKDADAKAMYCGRAAAGVVIITTKHGRNL